MLILLSEEMANSEHLLLCKCTESILAKSWILTVINDSSIGNQLRLIYSACWSF